MATLLDFKIYEIFKEEDFTSFFGRDGFDFMDQNSTNDTIKITFSSEITKINLTNTFFIKNFNFVFEATSLKINVFSYFGKAFEITNSPFIFIKGITFNINFSSNKTLIVFIYNSTIVTLTDLIFTGKYIENGVNLINISKVQIINLIGIEFLQWNLLFQDEYLISVIQSDFILFKKRS